MKKPREDAGPDLRIQRAGTVALILPVTPRAWAWVDERVAFDEWQRLGDGVAVEPATVAAIAEGARADGLIVEDAGAE